MYVETAACPQAFERTLNLGGQQVRVSVRGVGSGPPLLLMNGVGGSLNLWDTLRSTMHRRTIAFDAPGTGGSNTPLVPLSIGGHARIALELLDRLGVAQVDVLGFSFGGLVAQELARLAPARVERLVLASTSCGWGGIPGFPLAMLDLASPDRCYALSVPDRPQRVSVWGYAYQLWAASIWSSLSWIFDVGQPTLVVAGEADLLVPHLNADLLVTLMPRARKLLVRGGSHLCLLEEATSLGPRIEEFLNERDQPASAANHSGPARPSRSLR